MEKTLAEVEGQRKRMKTKELEINALQQKLNDERRCTCRVNIMSVIYLYSVRYTIMYNVHVYVCCVCVYYCYFLYYCRNLQSDLDRERSRLKTDHTTKSELEK